MKRRLVKGGNNSYTVTLSKDFVNRNNLVESKDLLLEDLGEVLLIKPDKELKKKSLEISIGADNLDLSIIKLKSLYYQGFNEITIKVSDEDGVREIVDESITQLWGINHYHKDGNIIIYDDKHQNDCTYILQKCFKEILLIAKHISEYMDSDSWYSTLSSGYNKVMCRLDFVNRLLNTNTCKCLKKFQRNHAIVLILQLIASSLNRIGLKLNETFSVNVLEEIELLLKIAYKVCFKKYDIEELLKHLSIQTFCKDGCWLCHELEMIKVKCQRLAESMIEI